MPTGELYVQLSVNFADNPKVRALARFRRDARAARDLYVQMCLYCKRTKSDGFVPEEQVGLLVYPDPESVGKRDAGHLTEVDLIEKVAGGYRVIGWLERNASRADIERKSEAKARGARLANHRRWHVEQDNPDPDCEWCRKESQNTDQTTDQNTDESSDQYAESDRIGAVKRSDSKEKDKETESETEEVKPLGRQKPAGRKIEPGSDDDPDFAAFWNVYPRKAGKGQARPAWKTAITKRKADPKAIILAAERYRDDPRRRASEPKFTKHPGTWLNGECWLEYQDGAPADLAAVAGYSNSPWDN